jgi:hypothetical protein
VIVKVQVSLASSDGVTRVLIYNQNCTFEYEGGINEDMVETMAGRAKAYFEASMGPDGLEIGEELEDQSW